MKKAIILILVFVTAHAIPLASRALSECIDYSFINNGAMRQLFYVFVAYALQLALTVVALKLFVSNRLKDAGFNMNNRAQSVTSLRHFMLAWTGILIVFYALALIVFPPFLDYLRSFCPPDALYGVKNAVGGSVLPGLGEEPLYRSFVVLVLARHWQGDIRIGRLRVSHVSLLCGFIFMTAHVGYTFAPHFEIVHIDALQLTYTFVLGITWATVFEKTKSLFAPVLSHIWANFIQYVLAYVAVFLLFQT